MAGSGGGADPSGACVDAVQTGNLLFVNGSLRDLIEPRR
jgi:hypothetical protein